VVCNGLVEFTACLTAALEREARMILPSFFLARSKPQPSITQPMVGVPYYFRPPTFPGSQVTGMRHETLYRNIMRGAKLDAVSIPVGDTTVRVPPNLANIEKNGERYASSGMISIDWRTYLNRVQRRSLLLPAASAATKGDGKHEGRSCSVSCTGGQAESSCTAERYSRRRSG
jgi:hypothetical protein